MRLSYLVAKPAAQSTAVSPSPAPVISSAAEKSPATTPAAAAPRRRAAKSGSALSMSALLEEKPEEAAPAEAAAQDVALPADETVRLQWKELAKQYENRPRLASMLASGTIDVREENGVKLIDFLVLNDAQKQWVEEKLLRDLESRVRDLLSCPKINILVSVKPMDESAEKVPYMPEEKAKDLMEKNPDVRAFVADLGLDTK